MGEDCDVSYGKKRKCVLDKLLLGRGSSSSAVSYEFNINELTTYIK